MLNRFKALVVVLSCAALLVGASGCKKSDNFIDHVIVTPSENLEAVTVAIAFSKKVQTTLSAAFAIKQYGVLFLSPYSDTQPFEIGFTLNTSVFNDQDYVKLEPTLYLPNGTPIGIGYPIVEVRPDKPLNPNFDVSAYVDVLHTSWLGAGSTFKFIDDKYFPAGLSVSQVFNRDAQGHPSILAYAFGPTLKDDGTLAKPGGIAVFANVRKLLEKKKPAIYKGEDQIILEGPAAPEYEGNAPALIKLNNQMIKGLNRLK